MSQVSRDEPTILGLDLVGLNTDYKTGRARSSRPTPDTLDQRLQKQFNVKLLGVWPFGPQVIFCKPPITKLADLKGLKVRVYDQILAKFMEKIGATPVTMAFAEVAPGPVARRRRLRRDRPELGQLRRLAGERDALSPLGAAGRGAGLRASR